MRKLSDRKVSTSPKYGEIPRESTRVVRPFEGPGTPILREYTTVDLVTKKVLDLLDWILVMISKMSLECKMEIESRGSWTRLRGREMGVTLERCQTLVNVSMDYLQRQFTAPQEPHPT